MPITQVDIEGAEELIEDLRSLTRANMEDEADRLAHRIGAVQTTECDLVAATALSGSTSARNLARAGFTLAYVQVVMTQPGG